MAKKIHLHIGTHKTGSTAIQRFLVDQWRALAERGYAVFGSDRDSFQHAELYLASMRYERDSFAKLRSGRSYGPGYTKKITKRVHSFLAETASSDVIMTTEGLSLLRFDDEIDRLRDVLDAEKNEVSIILFLRNRRDYLNSYRKQVLKVAGRELSSEKSSSLYVEDDSWLGDFDALKHAYEKGFPGRLNIIDYDREMRERGNILPAYLEAIGIEDTFEGLDNYFVNVSAPDS